jgi:HTH-type transcriptional regulator / antitoxin HigA
MENVTKFIPAVSFHPGVTLAEKLDELNMPIKEFAIRVDKPEKTIHAVLNGSSSITSDMAILFERVLSIPATFWLKKQSNYDEYSARQKALEAQSQQTEWAKNFPKMIHFLIYFSDFLR